MFKPFELKEGMVLCPGVRRLISEAALYSLCQSLAESAENRPKVSELYLTDLNGGDLGRETGKSFRTMAEWEMDTDVVCLDDKK